VTAVSSAVAWGSAAPDSSQKAAPATFSAPQFVQRTVPPVVVPAPVEVAAGVEATMPPTGADVAALLVSAVRRAPHSSQKA
jgi:hypothetical protein